MFMGSPPSGRAYPPGQTGPKGKTVKIRRGPAAVTLALLHIGWEENFLGLC